MEKILKHIQIKMGVGSHPTPIEVIQPVQRPGYKPKQLMKKKIPLCSIITVQN